MRIRSAIGVSVIVLLSSPFLVHDVWAQEAGRTRTVSPSLYNAIEQRLLLEDAMIASDPASLTAEQAQELLSRVMTAGFVPDVGSIVKKSDGYSISTGLTGAAVGYVPYGVYTLSMQPIDDIRMIPPSRVLVTGDQVTIDMGMQEKKGSRSVDSVRSKTLTSSVFSGWMHALQGVIPWGKKVPSEGGKNVGATAVTFQLFTDSNGNGVRESGEAAVPWAQVKGVLTKVSNERVVELVTGKNTVALDDVPLNATSAFAIASEAVAHGAGDVVVAQAFTGDVIGLKSGVVYGNDFSLHAGQTYDVTIQHPSTLTFVYLP